MIKIDEDDRTTIHLTRGDSTDGYNNKICFTVPYIDEVTEETKYKEVQTTDEISFIVFDKKGYTKKEILRKKYTLASIGYISATTTPELVLTSTDTKKFPLKNKKATYWYNIVLNDDKTVVGHDEDGAKKIIVYPESEEE